MMNDPSISNFALPREAIIEFQEIWNRKYKNKLSYERAETESKELVGLTILALNSKAIEK